MRVLEGILRRDYFPDLPPLLFSDESENSNLNLDEFQAAYTTEDDYSFNKLMDKLNRERRKRFKQTYKTDYQLITLSNPNVNSALEYPMDDEKTVVNEGIIRAENTRLLGDADEMPARDTLPHTRRLAQQHPVRRNFVPMTPQNSANVTSPAARNLLKSIRSRAITKESPFGGSTPQRKPNRKI